MKLPADSAPWYRHRWPWILMAGPFVVVVAGAITLYLAVVSNDGLVDDDYYKQGLAINQLTERDQNALRLGISAQLARGADNVRIRIVLRARPDTAMPATLGLRLAHPTRSGVDQNLLLVADGPGVYAGTLAAPLAGRWHVVIEDNSKQWRLTGVWRIDEDAVLNLPPAP